MKFNPQSIFRWFRSPYLWFTLAALVLGGLVGYDQFGGGSVFGARKAARLEAEGNAVGGGCRQSGRAIEDCYSIYTWLPKEAVFDGWLEMDVYMRENNLVTIPPLLPPAQPPAPPPAPVAPEPPKKPETSKKKKRSSAKEEAEEAEEAEKKAAAAAPAPAVTPAPVPLPVYTPPPAPSTPTPVPLPLAPSIPDDEPMPPPDAFVAPPNAVASFQP
ncbi:MAG: hypothetical protein LBQ75_00280 [Zoogloeaceae bacterium]|jgi:hypothetical protein|nr:hypothetical protein [Zoogloeaceae bacterium]